MMRKTIARLLAPAGATGALVLFASGPAAAEVTAETAYIFNTFLFLVGGFLVMWMAAGFAMLESGLVRSKNTATICLKNIALYSIAGLMYYLIGYSFMYGGANGFFGGFGAIPYNTGAGGLESAVTILGGEGSNAEFTDVGYSQMSDWFFQMVFVATAASIVSGTIAERMKLWPFLIFVVILTGIIYPIQAAWTWGGGWLTELGFSDFAGSTIVHSVGGWAALMGAIIVGPRAGKYTKDGRVNPMPGANLPLATLGTFILWLGWFGFNGGSQLAMGTAADVAAVAVVFVNTNLAAAAGVVAAMLLSQILYKKVDLTFALNGASAGLVSITAGPDMANHLIAILIGAIGGALAVIAIPLLDRLKIDDVVGAISAHLVAGIWGTLAVALTNPSALVPNIIGILAVGAFVIVTSAIVWYALKATIGLRVSEEAEADGLDKSELGMEAYPEFGMASVR
jgi:Amt family ammonium transporter